MAVDYALGASTQGCTQTGQPWPSSPVPEVE